MSRKCPKCGYLGPVGRPRKIDDAQVLKLKTIGLSLAEIASRMDVPKSTIQSSLARSKKNR